MPIDTERKLPIYINESTKDLLEYFGSGSHKPGSGSAAALQGMLSSQLLITVINRSIENTGNNNWILELEEYDKEIKSGILPKIESLFQEDSQKFHEHMIIRERANLEEDKSKKRKMRAELWQSLIPCTEIPLDIAKNCERLAEISEILFDKGFSAVRGDTGVALNSAISVIGGCLSIIDLNLTYFPKNKFSIGIRKDSERLRTVFQKLSADTVKRLESLKKEADYKRDLNLLKQGFWNNSKLSYSDIEEIAALTQNTLWKYRDKIWGNETTASHLDILRPESGLKILGYKYFKQATLGQHIVQGSTSEIAATINKDDMTVEISEQFPPDVRNFTAAHELGHALLHDFQILHRDRPVDGTNSSATRPKVEKQADKFATYFLMPRKQVVKVFKELYLSNKFIIEQDTVFALNQESTTVFRKKCKNIHGLAKFIASNEIYRGTSFNSISKLFGVSEGSMSIRLVELNLIEF